jgi:hypothetical protein
MKWVNQSSFRCRLQYNNLRTPTFTLIRSPQHRCRWMYSATGSFTATTSAVESPTTKKVCTLPGPSTHRYRAVHTSLSYDVKGPLARPTDKILLGLSRDATGPFMCPSATRPIILNDSPNAPQLPGDGLLRPLASATRLQGLLRTPLLARYRASYTIIGDHATGHPTHPLATTL